MLGIILLASLLAALAGYMAVAAVAVQSLSQPRRKLPLNVPADAGLVYEDIRLQARGEALMIAAWHIPAPQATRAVIITHGLGGCRSREFTISSLPLVEYLVSSGFTVLMLDLRGHGASDAARMTYGIRERRDVLGAVDWLLAQGYAPGAIGVLGTSMGGVASIGAAGEEPAIGALIIDSAYANFPAMLRPHFRRFTKLPLFFLPATLLLWRLIVGENLARLRPDEQLRAIDRRPVLIIHARRDRLVPVEHAHALAQAGDAELWITRSAHHTGSFGSDTHAYSERVTQFFRRSLAGPLDAYALGDDMLDIKREPSSATNRPLLAVVYGTQAQPQPSSRGRLQLRWRITPYGLRLHWEKVPAMAAGDEQLIADDRYESVAISQERVA